MVTNSSLDRMKKDVIVNLSKDKLKSYIFYLTKKYYESYLAGDEKAFNQVFAQLYALNDEYNETYVNLLGFIYFCLNVNANAIMMNEHEDIKFKLKYIANYDLYEDEELEEDLKFDIKNIFNKERIEARYDEKEND